VDYLLNIKSCYTVTGDFCRPPLLTINPRCLLLMAYLFFLFSYRVLVYRTIQEPVFVFHKIIVHKRA